MMAVMDYLLQDRELAGALLSKKLASYKDDNAVVVGIPRGGVCVASAIADALSLPLEVIPCRRIKHPGDGKKTIGSVSVNEVFIHDFIQDIPQDYVFHQTAALRNSLQDEYQQYYGDTEPVSFQYKTVIVVDDVLQSGDTILACIRSIKKQKPLKVIVAIPIVTAEAARVVRAEADDLVFLQMENTIVSGKDYFENFPAVDQRKVKELLDLSRKTLCLYE